MNLPIDIPSGGPGIIVDLFAGGGGASEGIRMALGRDPDLAINHDPEAVAMHKQNHPNCRHLIEDVWTVDPSWATQGKPMTGKLVREIVRELEDLKKLKKAVRLLAITAQPVLNEDGHLWITKHAVDKLAALVGEEGK